MRIRALTASLSALAVVGLGVAPAAADDHVVVDGLVSPLGFAVGSDGTIYVAEAFIGQLTAVAKDGTRTVLAAAPGGSFTTGVDARGRGTVTYTVSLPPEFENGPPSDTALNRVLPNGSSRTLASMLAYETANNPDAANLYGIVSSEECATAASALSDFIGPPSTYGVIESNPYAVAIDTDGSRVVADAAGNSILRVRANGRVSTVGVLPPITQTLTAATLAGLLGEVNAVLEEMGQEPFPEDTLDACIGADYESNPVPTDVEVGPDGSYYVSALPGFPENPGTGVVFRMDRADGSVTPVATGFSGAVDLAVTGNGTIYVAELFAFQVSRVDPGDSAASASAFVECPSAVEFARGHGLLVATAGICQDGPPVPGQIVHLDL